ncbi:hypothetical protein ACFYY8_31265 [Streptosporangium sp. NPDC001559]|uniref:hypothetical protein n=1 Tax=Streptosporangium sp. NPDC001559 TaxID=3366187 RepID=UPI0036E461C1
MTVLERVLYTLACLLLPAPKGRRHRPASTKSEAGLSDDTVPFRTVNARHPYPDLTEEPTA